MRNATLLTQALRGRSIWRQEDTRIYGKQLGFFVPANDQATERSS
jgi:hypothetical protein